MTNIMTLTNSNLNSGTAVRLLAAEFNYSWQSLISANPSNSSHATVEPVSNGWENPLLNITFHIPTESIPSGSMTWLLWNQFVKAIFNYPTADTTLAITYGDADNTFKDYSSTAADVTGVISIPVMIKSYSLRFAPGDSRNSAHWVINAQLVVYS